MKIRWTRPNFNIDSCSFSALHVVEHFPKSMPIYQIPAENIDPEEFLKNDARDELAKVARRLGLERIEQHVLVSPRSAKHEIVHFAKDRKVDLIVVGTHGRHGIQSYRDGCFARRLLRRLDRARLASGRHGPQDFVKRETDPWGQAARVALYLPAPRVRA